jgi:hypothetical protein
MSAMIDTLLTFVVGSAVGWVLSVEWEIARIERAEHKLAKRFEKSIEKTKE